VQENTERLRVLLSGDLDLLDVDDEDARTAGQVRASLEKAGTPIGACDLPIAGQALRCGLTAVAANADFRTGGSGQRSGDFVADGAAAPPGDGGGGGEVCLAEDG
jgi:tRNA(fMet)-specific endonuclease VapC